jgi:outer membrane immunogenic protein
MKKLLLCSVAAAALMVGPAVAADMRAPVTKAPPRAVAPGYSWTGCYIGVQGGFAWQGVNNSFSVTGLDPFTAEGDQDGSGGVVGGHVGCNLQTGHWVWGIEGDGEWASIKGDDGGIGGDTNEFKVRFMASIRGRLGVTWDRTLFYATGGVAFMGARSSVLDPGEQERISDTLTGWTVGAGIEHAFTPNFTARIEYRYADFGEKDFVFPINGYTERHDIHVHAVRFGLTYKFGGPVVARY